MTTPNNWTALLNQAVANMHINAMPKKPKAEDWFMLRERWNKYPKSQRAFYLATALGRCLLAAAEKSQTVEPEIIAKFQANLGLEDYSDCEKRMIAAAIRDAERYSKLDNALISQQRALKKRLSRPD